MAAAPGDVYLRKGDMPLASRVSGTPKSQAGDRTPATVGRMGDQQ
jgi:hypothetical protein